MIDRRHFMASSLGFLAAGDVPAVAQSPALAPAIGPYALPGTFVHPLPNPVGGRRYEAWVDVPKGLDDTDVPRPAVFVTNAPYAFPVVRSLRGRVGQGGRNLADFVLIGLAPAADESSGDMRNRAYMAWNTARMHKVVERLKRDGIPVEEDWLRRIGPAHFSHINFRGTMKFGVEKFAAALIQRVPGQATRTAS
jgi:hypothetical protein